MAKKDRQEPPRQPSPNLGGAKSAAMALAVMTSIAASSGIISYYHQEHIQQELKDAANPLLSGSLEKALGTVLKEKSEAYAEGYAIETQTVAAMSKWMIAFDERQTIAEEILDATRGSSEHIPLKDAVRDMVGSVYEGKESRRSFGDLAVLFGEQVAAGPDVGIMQGLLAMVGLSELPSNDFSYRMRPKDNPYVKQVAEQDAQINTNLLVALDVTMNQAMKDADAKYAAADMFKDANARVKDIKEKVDALKITVTSDRNRPDDRPDEEELKQHDFLLKALSQVQEHLDETRHSLTLDAGQNVKLISKHLGEARTVLSKTENQLDNTLRWFEGEAQNPEAPNTDVATMKPLRELVETQHMLVIAMVADVKRVQDVIDGRLPEEDIIKQANALKGSADALTKKLDAIPEKAELTDKETAPLLKQLKDFERESRKFEETVKLTFPIHEEGVDYSKYERDAERKEQRRQAKEGIKGDPNFKDENARIHMAESLETYAQNLEGWIKTWEKAAEGHRQLDQEQKDRFSPAYMDKLVKTFKDLIKIEQERAHELAVVADKYDKALIRLNDAEKNYVQVLKRMKVEHFDFDGYVAEREAKEAKARGRSQPSGEDGDGPVTGYKYPGYQQPGHAYRGFHPTGNSGYSANPDNVPMDMDFTYRGPTGNAKEILDNIWPQRGIRDAPVREKIFDALKDVAGKEDPAITAERVRILREAYADVGKSRGQMMSEIGTPHANYCQGAISHWYGEKLISRNSSGNAQANVGAFVQDAKRSNAFVPVGNKMPKPADTLAWGGHVALVVDSDAETGKVTFISGNNLYGQTLEKRPQQWPDMRTDRKVPIPFLGHVSLEALAYAKKPELQENLKAQQEKTDSQPPSTREAGDKADVQGTPSRGRDWRQEGWTP